jgi:hypothetical protein
MNSCKNCKHWNTYGDSNWGGECVRLLHCWMIKMITETEWQYGPHGDYPVDHEVERIDTDALFYCNQWETQ